MKDVASSNIAKIGYADGKLTVEFKSGGVWDYSDVPAGVHDEMMAAHDRGDSVGQFFHRHIKPHYTATKREDESK